MKKVIWVLYLTSSLLNAGTISISEKPKAVAVENSANKGAKVVHRRNKNPVKTKDEVSFHQSSTADDNAQIKNNSINLDLLRSNIVDYTNAFDVLSGSVLRGRILNSIVSSNLESPIVVEVIESNFGIPNGSKFICGGITKNKRVTGVCDKLVTDSDEYQVNVTLLNTDGTSGLAGEIYSGKEKFMVGAIGTVFLRSALEISQDRLPTYTGEMVKSTEKNKLLGGTIGSLDQGIQIMADEMKTEEMKISINAGKEILIFFNQRFKQ
jgi:hypothetical protein